MLNYAWIASSVTGIQFIWISRIHRWLINFQSRVGSAALEAEEIVLNVHRRRYILLLAVMGNNCFEYGLQKTV